MMEAGSWIYGNGGIFSGGFTKLDALALGGQLN